MRSAIGIDIGGTHLRAARVDAEGRVLATARDRSDRDPELVLRRVEALIARLDDAAVAAIGIGVPGRVDFASRTVLSGGYVDLSGVPLAAHVERRFGRPVVIDNDCAMALVAEARIGAARLARSVVMLTIGTGIGGAVIEDGRILRGRQTAGQLGHVSADPHGLPCLCGKRGCLETVSSGSSLARHVREAGLDAATTAAELLARTEVGDSTARAVLDAWAGPLSRAIDDLAATLDPDLVVLGGGLGTEAAEAVRGISRPRSWYEARIAAALLGDEAGVVGAALAALAARRDKRLVLVNGVPASGKSSVARGLSVLTGWPVLALDTVKEPFLGEIGGVDRPFNRKLGRASMAAMFAIVAEAPPGASFILDAWFGFQPRDWLDGLLAASGVEDITEIWCSTDPELIGARYAARAADRPAGHPGLDYVPELVALAGRARPLGMARLIEVDTGRPVDIDALRRRLEPT